MCNRECPEFSKSYGTCCLCSYILGGLKCDFYKCDRNNRSECAEAIAEDNLIAEWEAHHEPPDYIHFEDED